MPGALPVQINLFQPVGERPAAGRQHIPPTVGLPRCEHGPCPGLERRARDERGGDLEALAVLLPVDMEAQVIHLIAGAPLEVHHPVLHPVIGQGVRLREVHQRGRVALLRRGPAGGRAERGG